MGGAYLESCCDDSDDGKWRKEEKEKKKQHHKPGFCQCDLLGTVPIRENCLPQNSYNNKLKHLWLLWFINLQTKII